MNSEELKNKIIEFLKKYTLAVISTIDVDGKKPESALVAFTEKENLEIIFGTSNTTRKYKNIQENPHVSFVVGWDGAIGTLQYDGIARELSSEESKTHSDAHIAKNPGSEKYVNLQDQRYFLVKPTWIRLVDNIENNVHEINF